MMKMPRLAFSLLVLALAAVIGLCLFLEPVPAGQPYALAEASLPPQALELAAQSGLPVLSIVTRTGQLPGEAEEPGILTLLEGSSSRSWHIRINVRGNTSQRFPKKSYRVKITDNRGGKLDASLAGLRGDDDWILNPMYTDTSKVREALAYEMWEMMNSAGSRAASSRLVYGEVFINGEYWGLYGLQERIDRKQVDANRHAGVLYKVFANDRPTVTELLETEEREIFRGFKVAFMGDRVERPFLPAASYMALLSGEANPFEARLDLLNAVDYGLWAMVTQAHDCHFKNQFLNAVYTENGYVLYKIPWDVNNTFGDIWRNDAQATNHTAFSVGDLVLDGAFEALLASGDPAVFRAVQDRWAELRRGPLQAEKLIARAHALYDPLGEALYRDDLRWPQGGMGSGNALNIRDIEDFFHEILPRMDHYVKTLGTGANAYGQDLDR